jgi:ABC-2 type transport system permease protein
MTRQADINDRVDNITQIARKEIANFFSSYSGYVFLGSFLVAVFVKFFWIDTFIARNLADVRPLFESMPVLMAFLVPVLTMRMWSEERRSGTLEFLLSTPLSNWEPVLGKYVACLSLAIIALILTLPLTFSVAMVGPIDWGPVWGGYLASILLASAYAAIGLFISSRTDNQVVSVLLSAMICGSFVLIGSDAFCAYFPNDVADTLRLFGTGSRFQSIARGVLDFRDLYFYLSLTGSFLSLNCLSLEAIRWSGNKSNWTHNVWTIVTSLLVMNFLAANLWLQQCDRLRVDLTEGHIYSISPVTRSYLNSLKQPLLIRAYFSNKTHPALAPLVPRLRDLLKEYALAGKGKVHLEIVDPLEQPQLAKEAAEKFAIKPMTLQTASKYQAAVTASYFDLLIKYGDQFQKLGYRELLDAKARTEKDIQVELKNPEYDITRAIKLVLEAYQTQGNPFDGIDQNLEFCGYISADDQLPEPLRTLKQSLLTSLRELEKSSSGKFSYRLQDPDADAGKLADTLKKEFGLKPFARSSTDPRTFWFYMTFRSASDHNKMFVSGPPQDVSSTSLENDLKSMVRKFSKQSLKTLGIAEPPKPLGLEIISKGAYQKQYQALKNMLAQNYNLQSLSLKLGKVPAGIDLLLVLDPEDLEEKALFAIDQYLMTGGTVIICSGSFDCSVFRPLTCRPIKSGLSAWLRHNGVEIKEAMVLDKQASPFAMPSTQYVDGYPMETTQIIAYPYFVDIRPDGMNKDELLTSKLGQVTLSFASPISINEEASHGFKVIPLLHSSRQSWTSNSTSIIPNFALYPNVGFVEAVKKQPELLAVSLEGRFSSYFKDKNSPLETTDDGHKQASGLANSGAGLSKPLESSPQEARIILFSSNSFLSDNVLKLESAALGNQYTNALTLLENAVDWSLEDRQLLSIRGNRFFARTLRIKDPLLAASFEYCNYLLGMAALGCIWLIYRRLEHRSRTRHKALLNEATALVTKQAV